MSRERRKGEGAEKRSWEKKRSNIAPASVTISLDTSRNLVPLTPSGDQPDPIDVVQANEPPPGRDDVIGLWRWYITRYDWTPLSALFVARLQTSAQQLAALARRVGKR